ncbi:hypothetical protein N1F78_06215 [Seonamhaeicola sp. MEBiC1930]|uniref:hypothetical protein n=1 Tax=Seonamhaeicola sp. MEBiC01930 TaxID=2976768 RepID=UPI00325335C9
MMFRKFETYIGNQRFIIEEDLPEIGWYIYVFDNNGKCISDHLQDDYNTAVAFAHEEYKIEKNNWMLIKD